MTGSELLHWRKRMGWTQQQLADALDIPSNTVARWEHGELTIRHGTILRLALESLRRLDRTDTGTRVTVSRKR